MARNSLESKKDLSTTQIPEAKKEIKFDYIKMKFLLNKNHCMQCQKQTRKRVFATHTTD